MDIAEITAKARVLLEALPYIQDFRGSIFVVKYGGSFMDDPDPAIRTRVAYDIAFLAGVGINVVVIHGGGKVPYPAVELLECVVVLCSGDDQRVYLTQQLFIRFNCQRFADHLDSQLLFANVVGERADDFLTSGGDRNLGAADFARP